MSRLLLAPLILLLLLVIAAAVLMPLLLDTDKVLQLAAAVLHQQTGATLTVEGERELSLFPRLGVTLSDAAITLPDQQAPDIRVDSLQIGVQLLPLLRGDVVIDSILVDGLDAQFERSEKPSGGGASQADAAAGAGVALAAPLALNVRHLVITHSRLQSVDTTGAVSAVELERLEISGLNMEQRPFPVALTLRVPGERPLALQLDGNLRVDQRAQQIAVDELTAVISGDTATPVTLQASGTIDVPSEAADLQLALDLGEAHGKGTLRYSGRASPGIDARLQFNLLDPALLALAGPEAAAAPGSKRDAGGADEPLPLDVLRALDTHAVLDIEAARIGAYVVNTLHADVRALDGVLRLTELTGKVYGGSLKASATLDGTRDTATLTTRGKLDGLDIAGALAAAKSRPLLTGSASLGWQLGSRGRSQDELVAALDGPVTVTTDAVVLQGTSVEKLLCQAVALTNKEPLTATFPDNTRFETLGADIRVAGGKAALSPLRAALPGIALTGTGEYDLLGQDFEATFRPACRRNWNNSITPAA
ncbi:MAG: AsmA family protein [Halioglobus sp.]